MMFFTELHFSISSSPTSENSLEKYLVDFERWDVFLIGTVNLALKEETKHGSPVPIT